MNRRKLRFNAIDAILLLIIAAVIFAVLYIFVFSEDSDQTAETNYKTIQYTVLIQNIEEHFDEIIKVGQTVTDGVEKKSIGTVVGVQATPMMMTTFDYDRGREVDAPVEGQINVKITIEAQAVETDRALTVDGCDIRVGQQYSLMLPEIYCVGYCIDINDELQN